MAQKRDLDATDREIVELLIEDGRRTYQDLGDSVGLSATAVSERIDRLRDQGIIRRFTVEIDRSILSSRQPILIDIQVEPTAVESVFEAIQSLGTIEHAFLTSNCRIIAHGVSPGRDPGAWLRSSVPMDAVQTFSIELLEHYAWQSTMAGMDFDLSCVVCGNSVGDGGMTVEINGDLQSFCCPSCRASYEERLEAYQSRT